MGVATTSVLPAPPQEVQYKAARQTTARIASFAWAEWRGPACILHDFPASVAPASDGFLSFDSQQQFRCHAANAKVPLPSTGVYGTKVPPDRLGRVFRAREPVASCGVLDVLAGFGLPGCLEEVMRRHVLRKGETNSFVGRTLCPPSGNHKGCPTRTLCTSYGRELRRE